MLQYVDATASLHKAHRRASWALRRGSIVKDREPSRASVILKNKIALRSFGKCSIHYYILNGIKYPKRLHTCYLRENCFSSRRQTSRSNMAGRGLLTVPMDRSQVPTEAQKSQIKFKYKLLKHSRP